MTAGRSVPIQVVRIALTGTLVAFPLLPILFAAPAQEGPAEAEAADKTRSTGDPAWVDLRIFGMDCEGCLSRIRSALMQLEGIPGLSVRLDMPIIAARYDPLRTQPEQIVAALARFGFQAIVVERMGPPGTESRTGATASRNPDRVYTNDDLPMGSRRPHAQELAGRPGGDEDVALRQFLEEQARQEREWRARFAEAHRRLRETESNAWRMVTRIVLVGGGTGLGGAGKGVAFPVPMKVWEFSETEELREARQALEALEEELRKAGLPPGWSRDEISIRAPRRGPARERVTEDALHG